MAEYRSELLRAPAPARRFYLALGCLILAAWAALIALQQSAYAELTSHEAMTAPGFPPSLRIAAFLACWFLMTVAMMLPGSLPQLSHFVQPFGQRLQNTRLVGLAMLGYVAPWVGFGLLAYLGDGFLHHLAEPGAPLAAFSAWIAPAIVLVAGLYQLTPGKRSYLQRCRLAHAPLLRGCLEGPGGAGALRQGLQLGVVCVGSCWSLMLLMFALGHNRLDWMLVLSAVMASERLTPWGHRLAWLVGAALILWATLWVLTAGHTGHSHL